MSNASPDTTIQYLVEVNEWKRCAANMLDYRDNWPDSMWESFGLMTNHLMVEAMRMRPGLAVEPLAELIDVATARNRPTPELFVRVIEGGEILDSAIAPKMLGKATDIPKDLDELATLIRIETPRKGCIIRLLEYMRDHDRATLEELQEYVHEGYMASEDTIESNVKKTRKLIRKYAIPVELRWSTASHEKKPVLLRMYKSS
jgi:hypothetical protein